MALRAGLPRCLPPGLRAALTALLKCAYGSAGAAGPTPPPARATVLAWARDVASHDGGVLVWTARGGSGGPPPPPPPRARARPASPPSPPPRTAAGPPSVLLYTHLAQEAGLAGGAGETEFRVAHALTVAPDSPTARAAPGASANDRDRGARTAAGYALPDGGVAPSIVPVVRALTAGLPGRHRALRAAVLELARGAAAAEAALRSAGFRGATVEVAAESAWPCDTGADGGTPGGDPPAEDTFPSLPLTDVRVTVQLEL